MEVGLSGGRLKEKLSIAFSFARSSLPCKQISGILGSFSYLALAAGTWLIVHNVHDALKSEHLKGEAVYATQAKGVQESQHESGYTARRSSFVHKMKKKKNVVESFTWVQITWILCLPVYSSIV